ncbi:MAG TPA: cytochrome c oxidase subunit II [Nitrospirota bacterium]|nr:cytochrome c oxidase subunit II [Nitrospirota bacterium]
MVTGWPNLSNPADDTFFFILGVSLTLLALNTGLMIYFVIRYSRKRHPRAEEVRENTPLEIMWTVIPTILVLAIFYVGWKGFVYMRSAPPDAMVVKVVARQWSWSFGYANGKETNTLKVPVGKPIKLLITSADVLHSLYIPAYRIKEDAVPGRETHLWFLPDEAGSYDLFCTEYCGLGHSAMITTVDVLSQKDFEAWYSGEKPPEAAKAGKQPGKPAAPKAGHTDDLAREGAELVRTKGCIACHTTDGTPKIGPTFKGIFGKKEIVIHDGKEREITVDEAFIRQTLLHPEIDRVKGFPPIMPPQQLTDDEIGRIVQYIKSLN